MEIVLFCLGVIGLTHIVVDSSIMLPLRDWVDKIFPEKVSKMIHCYQCCGFWCGLFCSWAAFSNLSVFHLFLGGFAGSFLPNFFATYMNYLDATIYEALPDKEQK